MKYSKWQSYYRQSDISMTFQKSLYACINRALLSVLFLMTVFGYAIAQGPDDQFHTSTDSTLFQMMLRDRQDKDDADSIANFTYGSKGWQFRTVNNHFLMQLQWRMQFRYTHASDIIPEPDLNEEDSPENSFTVQRARLKVGGHAYDTIIGYYLEYDFPSGRLLDFRMTLSPKDWLQFRFGQWKVNYNSERVVSSGKQQFADRSILNRVFTFDRQQGAMVFGHVFEGSLMDSWYHLGVFNGTGRGNPNDDEFFLWLGRYQWNFLKKDPDLTFSDTRFTKKPTAFLAFQGAYNRSLFTRFSSAGGGQLDGFAPGIIGQYDLIQSSIEFFFKYKGLSFMNENHWKQVDDNLNNTTTNLKGFYVMGGYFFHGLIERFPEHLEIGFRYAQMDQNTNVINNLEKEYTLVLNWFFKEHLNKLTLDASLLDLQEPGGAFLRDNRFRIQWDVSF